MSRVRMSRTLLPLPPALLPHLPLAVPTLPGSTILPTGSNFCLSFSVVLKSHQIFACVVHQIEALMDKVEDDMEGLVTSRDPTLLEEMIHRQAMTVKKQYSNHKIHSSNHIT